jgi:flagellar motor switch protein FliM
METTETTCLDQEAFVVAREPAVLTEPSSVTPQRDTFGEEVHCSDETARVTPQPYDFAQHLLLSTHEVRKLRSNCEEFLGGLAMRLSIYFRMEFELTLVSLTTPTYRQFVSSLVHPTHLTLLKIEPLRGISVLEISPAFGMALTDRLMGGPGEATAAARELSEIEVALLDQVAQFITEGWCGQWSQRQELKTNLIGHESDASYLQTSPPDSAMLVAKISASLGKCTGQIQLAFPFTTLEPLLQKLRAELKPAAESVSDDKMPKQRMWNSTLNDVKIAIAAQLPGPQLLGRAIPKLKVGDVIEMPTDSVNQVQLCLGGLSRFTGRLGTRDDFWAVEITNVLKT